MRNNDFCLNLPRLLDERRATPQRSEVEGQGDGLVQLKKEMEERLKKLQVDMQRKQDASEKTLSALQSKNQELEKALVMQARAQAFRVHPRSEELRLQRNWWLKQRKALMQELYPCGRK
mmetsp:Transcript_96792/g.118570  ORF Transcript_96792/g.118570 Transcript_96792/m.118570 type:complete len:119 (+) Transcript_96792:64-420(+)